MRKTRKKQQSEGGVYHEEYRILEQGTGKSKLYSIKRALLRDDEVQTLYNMDPVCDNLSSLRWQLRQIVEAFNKPVIRWKGYRWVEVKGVDMPSPESLFQKYKD